MASGTVVGMGSGSFALEAESGALLNDAWSRGLAEIQNHVSVRGILHASRRALGSGVTLGGSDTNPPFDPPTSLAWNVVFPTGPANDVSVNPGQPVTLTPGRYGNVEVHDGANLTLATGTYYLTGLTLHTHSAVNLKQANGPVIVYVSDTIVLNGSYVSLGGGEPDLLIGYLGQNSVIVQSVFDGVIVAPSALLALQPVGLHKGFFAAQDVDLRPGGQVQYRFPAALAVAVANAGVARLQQDTGVSWVMSRPPLAASELTVFLRPKADPGVTLPPGAKPQDAATAFLQKYADIFSIQDPTTELVLNAAHIGPSGIGYAAFQQVVNGVPVLGAGVTFMFNPKGRIDNISSHYTPGIRGMSTTPTIDGAAALASAQADMVTRFPSGTLGAALPSEPAVLFITPQPTGGARLAYHVAAIFAGQADQLIHFARDYVIDASTGSVLSSVDGNRRQFRGPGAPVPASGQGTIEKIRNLPIVRQFTAFSANPPKGPPFFMQPSVDPPIFVMVPGTVNQTPTTVSSNTLDSWDTAGRVPGAAVDAYVYFNYILSWWAEPSRGGRLSYDNNGAKIKIFVHEQGLLANAEWRSMEKEFHIGDADVPLVYPASAAVDSLGHEFQHAVNGAVFSGFDNLIVNGLVPDVAPLDESLGDVFGQFIESDFSAANSLGYKSSPLVQGEAHFAGNPHSGGWVRNLVDPHLPSDFQSASPDSMGDCLYDPKNDEHTNAGIPNRAWSIATFGGIDSTTGIGVDPSAKLGMAQSEQLYLELILHPPTLFWIPQAGQMFWQVAQVLASDARMLYGDQSPQQIAIACGWRGVDVFSDIDLLNLGWDQTKCATGKSSPCTSGDAGAPTQASCGVGGTLESCPGTPCQNAPSGPACSTDGTTLYTCNGNGGTVGGTLCSDGCLVSGLGPAACVAAAGAGAGGGGGPCSFLLNGKYCGGNGSGATDILYTCGGGNVVSATSCSSGCQINAVPAASAPPPGCSGVGAASCFGLPQGDYCGYDQVCGDPTLLFHCDGNNNISAVMSCPAGCSVLSSGSQAGGADNCTDSNRAGADSCRPGPQVPVPPGSAKKNCPPGQSPPNCCPVGQGPCFAGNSPNVGVGSGVPCNDNGIGDNFPDGLYCKGNTITLCQGGANKGIRTCSAGCQHHGSGADTCIGECAGVIGRAACASDGITLLHCNLTEIVARQTCSICETIQFPGIPNPLGGPPVIPPYIDSLCFGPCLSLPNGSNCASDGKTLLVCQNSSVVGQQACPQGCQGKQTGNDTCIGSCTNLSDGSDCSSDGATLLQCFNGNVMGQQPCPKGCQGNRTGNDACSP